LRHVEHTQATRAFQETALTVSVDANTHVDKRGSMPIQAACLAHLPNSPVRSNLAAQTLASIASFKPKAALHC
jgi:hypothetical protein